MSATVTINGSTISQPMCGFISAREWPATPPKEGGLYLLYLNSAPTEEDRSLANKEYEHFAQWVWLLIGTDIASGQVSQNRGDRYAANMQIMENLRQANYPGFCQAKDYALVGSAVVGTPAQTIVPAATGTMISSYVEMIKWSELRFIPRSDNQKSGLIYGAASVEIYARSNILPALA